MSWEKSLERQLRVEGMSDVSRAFNLFLSSSEQQHVSITPSNFLIFVKEERCQVKKKVFEPYYSKCSEDFTCILDTFRLC
jgi:hypothetical protein